jgi:hypothetical protein
MKPPSDYLRCSLVAALITASVLCVSRFVAVHLGPIIHQAITNPSAHDNLSAWEKSIVTTLVYAWGIWPITAVTVFAISFAECHQSTRWMRKHKFNKSRPGMENEQ